MALNRWGLGRESLGDAGREMLHELKSRIQPKIRSPRIIIFQKSKTIVAPTIPRPGAGRRELPVGNAGLAKRRRDSEYADSD